MFDPDRRFTIIWTLAGGYLVYLGDQLLTGWFHGEVEEYPIVSLVAGIVFVGFGGLLLFLAWKKWRSQKDLENEQKE